MGIKPVEVKKEDGIWVVTFSAGNIFIKFQLDEKGRPKERARWSEKQVYDRSESYLPRKTCAKLKEQAGAILREREAKDHSMGS